MKVSEFIEYLKTQPQDIEVVYQICSENAILEIEDIEVDELCEPRSDGWVPNKRPDKPYRTYLVLPGN